MANRWSSTKGAASETSCLETGQSGTSDHSTRRCPASQYASRTSLAQPRRRVEPAIQRNHEVSINPPRLKTNAITSHLKRGFYVPFDKADFRHA
jgi:hypothetical protein